MCLRDIGAVETDDCQSFSIFFGKFCAICLKIEAHYNRRAVTKLRVTRVTAVTKQGLKPIFLYIFCDFLKKLQHITIFHTIFA